METARLQTVVVARHGERLDSVDEDWAKRNVTRIYDPPLTSRGEAQATEAGRTIASKVKGIRHVISSPYLRCLQTSKAIADVLRLPSLGVNNDLSEYLEASLYRRKPNFPSPLMPTNIKLDDSGIDSPLPPLPEDKSVVFERFDRAINQTADKHWPRNLVLVTHVIGVSKAVCLGYPCDKIDVEKVDVCGYVTLQRECRGSLWKMIDSRGVHFVVIL